MLIYNNAPQIFPCKIQNKGQILLEIQYKYEILSLLALNYKTEKKSFLPE